MIEILINPGNKKIRIPAGTLALNALKQAGVIITTPCGAKGNCGKCKIKISPSDFELNSNEKKWLSKQEINQGFRLACQYHLNQATTITIPSHSLVEEKDSIIKGKIKSHLLDHKFKPVKQIKKIYLQLDCPTLQDQQSDWTRIVNALEGQLKEYHRSWNIPIDILNKIPQLLRENDFKITIVLFEDTIVAVEPGDSRDASYGIAFDIGTTTIAGYLIDLTTFSEIALVASDNPQRLYGDDVISRIDFALKDPNGNQKLQQELINKLNQMIFSLVQKAGIDDQKIYMAVLVGNTCMQHFFWCLTTENLAISPYIPVMTDSVLKKSLDLPKFCLMPHSIIYTAPNISAYVGGDIIADMIDISIWQHTGNALMIDLGTNGEIILTAQDKIWACSAAAGPAFEGARISSGMRAAFGAIDKVKITKQKIDYHVIGLKAKVAGLCGSGILDLIAGLLKIGIIQLNGRLIKQEECACDIAKTIKERIITGKDYHQFLVVPSQESVSGEPIYLTQKDIREVQLAKGAIYAGICILLGKAAIRPEDIDEILLAGAFGNIISPASALEIGIIPQIPLNRIRSIGNAAGQGAEKLLLSGEMREKAEMLAKKVHYIELSSHPNFQNIFAQSLYFGHH